MIRALILASTLLAAPVVSAQPVAKPKLLVVISVDQFSADLFAEYRGAWSGGMKRLGDGVVFPSGYQSHAATETCPGHSTILTGDHPSRTGIIANNWVDQGIARTDKGVYCAEDETRGTSSKAADYIPSSVHLRVPTLGDRMKDANPASRVVAVAGKDRAAIMMAGHKADAVWFLSARDFGRFDPLAGTPDSAPAQRANAALVATLAKAHAAMPLPAFCTARAHPVAIGATKTIGDGRFARPAGDKRLFRASPESDAATLGLARDMIDTMKLGRGPATDLIAIGLSATDYVGHTYGTEGSEMCIQLTALDAALGTFFKALDKSGVDYMVTLTADHGGHDAPERNRENALDTAKRIPGDFTYARLDSEIAKAIGVTGPVLASAEIGDIWFVRSLTAEQRANAQLRALELLRARPEVAAAFTADDLRATPPATSPPELWALAERARAAFDPARSGDIVILLKPRITPITAETAQGSYIATHGSPYDYDRRVPILFWRRGLTGFEQPNSVETVDIAPTLAAEIGLPVAPGDMDGRCLDLVSGPASSCP